MAAGNPSFGLTTQDLKSLSSSQGQTTVLDAETAGNSLTVPGGAMLLTADFSRAGPDLVIAGTGGERVVVQNYFTDADPPALRTAGGASLPPDIVTKLAGGGAGMQIAQDGGAALAGAQPIGTVNTVTGTVTAVRANGERVTLNTGDPVYQGDTISSARGGSLAVTFVDDSTFTVGENARMVLDELVYDPGTKTGTSAFSVVQGVFSFVSGQIAKTGSDAMTVRTPVATIGIRGTEVAIQAAAEGENNVITLLQERGGITGEIVITNSAGSQVLNQPFQTTSIASFFEAPSRPIIMPEAQVRQMFGNAIDQLQNQINQRTGGNRAETEGRAEERAEGPAAAAPTEVAAEAAPAAAGTPAAAAAEARAEAPAADDLTVGAVAAAAPATPAAAAPVDPIQAALAAAAAQIAAGGNVVLDDLIATAAGGEGFAGIEALPPPDFGAGIGTNSVLGQGTFDTGAQIITGLTATTSFVSDTTTRVTFEAPVGPPPDLTASSPEISARTPATGNEDTAIALNIDAAVTDLDGSESISTILISGVPLGAVLSAGTDNGNGTWTLTPAQLVNLTITPPKDSDADFTLTVTATATEISTGATATNSINLSVVVNPVADTPVMVFGAPASGNEDTAILLNFGAVVSDVTETISEIIIAGVPAGAVLSAGTDNGNGTWTLTQAQLNGLTITPPPNSDADIALVVRVTSSEGGTAASTVAGFVVDVKSVADAPTVTVTPSTGLEDNSISLNIAVALNDTDGSETITGITVAGVPAGATLSAGTDNGDGTWSLTPQQLTGLTITPPDDSDADLTLTVTAMSGEAVGGAGASAFKTLAVTVTGVADAPRVDVDDVTGSEGEPIELDLAVALEDVDGSEQIDTILISGVPAGALLSAGTDNGDGTWTLTPAQLVGLQITPPPGSDEDFTLTVTAVAAEGAGGTAATIATFEVNVSGVAGGPQVVASSIGGEEDSAIPLNIDVQLADLDGSESITDITVSGVPVGAALSAGTDNGDGTWTLSVAQLEGLTITPPANSSDDMELTVSATSSETDGDSATTIATLGVVVTGVADQATVTVTDTTGAEDTFIPLDIGVHLPDMDGSEMSVVAISGVPQGAVLSAGTDSGGGVWLVPTTDLAGLAIKPPADSSEDFALTVTAVTAEDGTIAFSDDVLLTVTVTGVADVPTVTVEAAAGAEDIAIPLEIAPVFADLDGSETMTVSIGGVPEGAELSAGTNNGDGTWTLTVADLEGLTITPPADSSDDFELTVTATTAEDGTTATSAPVVLTVAVTGVADEPKVTVANAAGAEDSEIPLAITAALDDIDGSETITNVTISGVPAGAELSAGTDNGDGTWTLTPGQLSGLTITPSANSSDDFTLTVSATSTEDDGDTATTVATLDVKVTGVADEPKVTVANASGAEDSEIPLSISAALEDIDSSETITDVTISGVPEGAELSAGTDNGDGTWTLTPAELSGLTITPPADSSDDFTLTVSATSTEDDGDTATTVATLDVAVSAVADKPIVTIADTTLETLEDGAIALGIGAALADTDGSETLGAIVISGVPAGATLSAGSDNGNGTWTLTPAELNGLTVTPAVNSDQDFTLTVTATSTEAAGGTATTVATLDVAVSAVADKPIVTIADTTLETLEDGAIALGIGAALADTDGSETLGAIVISGVPAGATLSAGSDNGNGTWTLTPAELNGLTITPPANATDDFTLTVTATSTEADGATATTVATLAVAVTGVVDTPTVTVTAAVGAEDSAIALDITPAIAGVDVGGDAEISAITITGLPSGATLSAGTNNGGVWTLTPDELEGLTITPAANSVADFTLSVSVTATENGTSATSTVATLPVTVTGVADVPTVTVGAVTGAEDTAIPEAALPPVGG